MKRGRDFIGVGVGAVILNENHEILLLLRRCPPEVDCWSIPGGAVELFETVEDAIIREIKEELGLDARVVALLNVTNHILENEGTHWVSPAFLINVVKGTPEIKEPEKHGGLKWFFIDDLPRNITMTTSSAIAGLKRYLGGIS